MAWVMWRQNLNPTWYSLDIDEDWALSNAQKDASFADICEGLLEWIDEEHIANRAATFIQKWTAEGLLKKIRTIKKPQIVK